VQRATVPEALPAKVFREAPDLSEEDGEGDAAVSAPRRAGGVAARNNAGRPRRDPPVQSVSFASLWWLLRREAAFQILTGNATGSQARRLRAVFARQEWLKLRVSAARALKRQRREA
jgi:hypothetical protein